MKKILRRILIIIEGLIVILAVGFLFYVNDYYRADETALAVLELDGVTLQQNGDIYFNALDLPDHEEDDLVIFYPGGKVEEQAYLPLAKKISEAGINVVVVKMPFRLAVLNINKADNYINKISGIDDYYLMGHSLGGAMASYYSSKNQETVSGLILLGAYLYGDYPEEKQLTIYGENDGGITENIDYEKNIYEIPGGNHAAFGNYGAQKGDGELEITREQQQNIAVEYIREFIGKGEF